MRSALIAGAAWCVALSATACNGDVPPSNGQDTFELANGAVAFSGTASMSALSALDQQTLIADRQYIRGLVPRNKAVSFNHADPRQHRFVLLRLKLAGKTPQNSPQLFKQIEKLRTTHLAKGLAVGSLTVLTTADDAVSSQHEMTATSVTDTPQGVKTGALASRKDPLDFGYNDSGLWCDDGSPIGDMNFVEVFESMPFITVQSSGSLSRAHCATLEGDSFLTETLTATGEIHESYVIGDAQLAEAIPASLDRPVVEHPLDSDRDGFITECLERTDRVACEYPQPTASNTAGRLIVPLKGNLSVKGTGVTLDWDRIANSYRTGLEEGGKIYFTLGTHGGGCTLPPGTVLGLTTMRDFWARVSRTPVLDPTKLSWDLFNNGDASTWATFSKSCAVTQAQAYVTMELKIPYKNSSDDSTGVLETTISNAIFTTQLASPPNLVYAPALRITNSCLAEGTVVAAPGAAARKIEDIQIGDKVNNPYTTSLTVTDTIAGTEKTPMVRIADARGRTLLATELHPLLVVDRGMVPAKLLKVGDRVQTDNGPSVLVSVTREAYTGKVYNLRVGNAQETTALGVDQTAMYANGFLVGDAQIQTKLDFQEQATIGAAAKRDRLPVAWKTDYQSSLARNARR